MVAYSDSLRLEEGDRITVTTVYPGYIRTRIHERSTAAGRAAWKAPCRSSASRTPRARWSARRSARRRATWRPRAAAASATRSCARCRGGLVDRVTLARMRRLARQRALRPGAGSPASTRSGSAAAARRAPAARRSAAAWRGTVAARKRQRIALRSIVGRRCGAERLEAGHALDVSHRVQKRTACGLDCVRYLNSKHRGGEELPRVRTPLARVTGRSLDARREKDSYGRGSRPRLRGSKPSSRVSSVADTSWRRARA